MRGSNMWRGVVAVVCCGLIWGCGASDDDADPAPLEEAVTGEEDPVEEDPVAEEPTKITDPADLLDMPEDGVQVTVGPFHLEPGEEKTMCAYMDMPVDVNRNVVRVETAMLNQSHHMNLYFAFSDLDKEGTMECGGEQMTSMIVFGAQLPYHDVPIPPGIGFPLPIRQQVILEAHYVNSSTEPIEAVGAVNLHFAPEGEDITVGGIMALFPPDIEVPPNSKATTTARCLVTLEGEIFMMMSHMHKFGLLFEAYHVDTTTEPETRTLVYKNEDWHKPEYTLLEPGEFLKVKPGDVLEFSCHYENYTDQPVLRGPSAETDEMCLFGTAYVPFQGILLCTEEEAVCPEPVIREEVDPTTSECAQFGDCAFRCDAFDFDCFNCCAPAMTVDCMFCTQGLLGCAVNSGCAQGLQDFDFGCVAANCMDEFSECFGQKLPDDL